MYKEKSYTQTPSILGVPNHDVRISRTFDPAAAYVTERDGKKIVPAGAIYPSNDAGALGVVFQDTDVSEGMRTDGVIVVHGFIRVDRMPVAPTPAAVAALKQITFMAPDMPYAGVTA